jgi:excisionase family DNA binding protein
MPNTDFMVQRETSCGPTWLNLATRFYGRQGMTMAKIEGEILTLDEVAVYLKAGKRTVYRLASAGQIPAFKLGGTWRFSRAEIEGWIKQQSTGTPERAASRASNKGDRQ